MDNDTTNRAWEALVWADRDRLGGEPCFRQTRVPIRVLFEYLQAGDGIDAFLDDFEGVTREQAVGVLRLASEAIELRLKAA